MRSIRISLAFGVALIATTASAATVPTSLFGLLGLAGVTEVRVHVTLENTSATSATYLTPVWVAFHDGTFDVYDLGVAASASLESLAEDGDASGLSTDFATAAVGQADAVIGSAPIAPGGIVQQSFLLDPTTTTARFFSFAAMVLPSNDAFIGNGDPTILPVFDAGTNFVFTNVHVSGTDVRDAGTEVNDELPANTAFFGQETPNTGTAEGGTVAIHTGFNAVGSGGILDDPRFAEGDFTAIGYPSMKIRMSAAPAITADRNHTVKLKGKFEVPEVSSKAKGAGTLDLLDNGTRIAFKLNFDKLKGVTGAHLHLGGVGENGDVVVDLLGDGKGGKLKKLKGDITAADLTGPLTAMPLDALATEMESGNVYVNVHTKKNPSGEIRGQVELVIPDP